MSSRETWTTRIGFLVAAIGSAVGLGNIWRFPFQTAKNGGAAFVVVYLLMLLVIAIPVMMSEFVIGRGTQLNPINAFDEIGHSNWKFAGVLPVVTVYIIFSYYTVVGGWVLRYFAGSFTGAYFGRAQAYFGSIASGPEAVVAHLVFMALTAGIVIFGVRQGLETATKTMVPTIAVLLVALALYVSTLSGAAEGYAYYLSPNLNSFLANALDVLPAATGQVVITLSLGLGIMITYSSYLGDESNLVQDGILIAVTNTAISLLAGFVVFPMLFTIGAAPKTSGAAAVFITVGSALGQLPAGRILGVLFFFLIAIAALSSSISILEVGVSYVLDNYDVSREKATVGLAGAAWLLGVPTAMSLKTLTIYDTIAGTTLPIFNVLFVTVFVGWIYHEEAVEELQRGIGDIGSWGTAWIWYLRVPLALVLLGAAVLAAQDILALL